MDTRTYFEMYDHEVGDSIQDVADFVVSRMVQQGGRCVDENGHCIYSGHNNTHCAVGWVWPDTGSKLEIEDLVEERELEAPDIIKANIDVFAALQAFHDSSYRERRKNALLRLASLGIKIDKPHWRQWMEMGE